MTKILFLGDMMLGENVYHLGRGIRSRYGDDYAHFIPDYIKEELLEGVDAVFYNFEYSLAPDSFDFKDFEQSIYASTVESLEVLPKRTLKVVNVANNHFWERGDDRTLFSLRSLKENGFVVVGEKASPVELNVGGKRLLVWGVSLIDWDVPVFTSNYEDLLEKMVIPKKKGEDEIWIMSIHWGTEFIPYPDKKQVELAHRLVDCGFDIVHGHHPHVFQPVENYGKGLIMYSMGNFLFDENFAKKTQLSYCLKVNLTEGYPSECLVMKNKHYRPYRVFNVARQNIEIKPDRYWSARKIRMTKKIYNILRKLEYLSHIADNNFFIYKSLKKRKQYE